MCVELRAGVAGEEDGAVSDSGGHMHRCPCAWAPHGQKWLSCELSHSWSIVLTDRRPLGGAVGAEAVWGRWEVCVRGGGAARVLQSHGSLCYPHAVSVIGMVINIRSARRGTGRVAGKSVCVRNAACAWNGVRQPNTRHHPARARAACGRRHGARGVAPRPRMLSQRLRK